MSNAGYLAIGLGVAVLAYVGWEYVQAQKTTATAGGTAIAADRTGDMAAEVFGKLASLGDALQPAPQVAIQPAPTPTAFGGTASLGGRVRAGFAKLPA